MIDAYGWEADIAPSVVLVYDSGLVPRKASPRRHRRSRHPFRQLASLTDDVDIVVATGPGAPVAAITVELLAAFGVSRIIAVGSAGRLDASASTPNTAVIERAESDEGTSAHYGDNLSADRTLTAALVHRLEIPAATALTTDVPFRHTSERLSTHRSRADFVEMECAALFAASHHAGLAAAAIVIGSDEFDGDNWRPVQPADEAFTSAIAAAAAVLSEA